VDYWAVDFNYESRKEIIRVPKGAGIAAVQGHLPGQEAAQRELELPAAEFEDRWTGAYIAVCVVDSYAASSSATASSSDWLSYCLSVR